MMKVIELFVILLVLVAAIAMLRFRGNVNRDVNRELMEH